MFIVLATPETSYCTLSTFRLAQASATDKRGAGYFKQCFFIQIYFTSQV